LRKLAHLDQTHHLPFPHKHLTITTPHLSSQLLLVGSLTHLPAASQIWHTTSKSLILAHSYVKELHQLQRSHLHRWGKVYRKRDKQAHMTSQMEDGRAANALTTTSKEEANATDARKRKTKMILKENQNTCPCARVREPQ
jgi:hypothetical protein